MRFFVIILIATILFPISADAYSTTNVPIDNRAYRQIDALVALGLIQKIIYGQRPWSRREFSRMVKEADDNYTNRPAEPQIAKILEKLKREFHQELTARNNNAPEKTVSFRLLEQLSFDYTLLDSNPRAILPVDNGLGEISAAINPLTAYRENRHYVDGHSLGLESAHRARVTRFLSFYGSPRLEILVPNTGSSEAKLLAQQLYAKLAYRNFETQIGRDSLIWGQGEFGGLMLSNNARPVDHIRFTNAEPLFLPWLLKYFGPTKISFFVANLGPEREFPHPFLYGIKGSIQPLRCFEFGINHTILLGGRGGPSLTWYDPITEFGFYRRGGARGQGTQSADHRMGVDWRLRVPWLRNFEWYAEALWDDFGRETTSVNFTQQMAFQSGLYWPNLEERGTSSLRIEATIIPPIIYRHGKWISGYALNKQLLGAADGPDSDAVSAKYTRRLSDKVLMNFKLGYYNYDSDVYSQTTSSRVGPDRVVKVTDNVTEHRLQVENVSDWKIDDKWTLQGRVGLAHIWNAGFQDGKKQNDFLAGFKVSYYP